MASRLERRSVSGSRASSSATVLRHLPVALLKWWVKHMDEVIDSMPTELHPRADRIHKMWSRRAHQGLWHLRGSLLVIVPVSVGHVAGCTALQ